MRDIDDDIWNWHGTVNDIATLSDEGYIKAERASSATRDLILYSLGFESRAEVKKFIRVLDREAKHESAVGDTQAAQVMQQLAGMLHTLADSKGLTKKQYQQAQEA